MPNGSYFRITLHEYNMLSKALESRREPDDSSPCKRFHQYGNRAFLVCQPGAYIRDKPCFPPRITEWRALRDRSHIHGNTRLHVVRGAIARTGLLEHKGCVLIVEFMSIPKHLGHEFLRDTDYCGIPQPPFRPERR
jgi:hypothetical protein